MPSFKQARDVLHHCQTFHRKVGGYYLTLRGNVVSPRVQLFLDYLVDHENKVADALVDYEESAPSRVMNTWFQTITVTDSLPIFDRVQLNPEMSLNDVLDIGLHFDTVLLDCYRVVRDSVEYAEVRDVFQNLFEFEEQEIQTLVRVAQSTADY